jgi:hypothetical protein
MLVDVADPRSGVAGVLVGHRPGAGRVALEHDDVVVRPNVLRAMLLLLFVAVGRRRCRRRGVVEGGALRQHDPAEGEHHRPHHRDQ